VVSRNDEESITVRRGVRGKSNLVARDLERMLWTVTKETERKKTMVD